MILGIRTYFRIIALFAVLNFSSSCAFSVIKKTEEKDILSTLNKGSYLMTKIESFKKDKKRYPVNLYELNKEGYLNHDQLYTDISKKGKFYLFFIIGNTSDPAEMFEYDLKNNNFSLSFYSYKEKQLEFFNMIPLFIERSENINSYNYFSDKEKASYYKQHGTVVSDCWIKN